MSAAPVPASGQPRVHDAAVAGMFGRIARFYDLLNRLLSLGVDQYWRRVLACNVTLGQGGVVLDLAAGTLDVALAVRRRHPTALVPALDFCRIARPSSQATRMDASSSRIHRGSPHA